MGDKSNNSEQGPYSDEVGFTPRKKEHFSGNTSASGRKNVSKGRSTPGKKVKCFPGDTRTVILGETMWTL